MNKENTVNRDGHNGINLLKLKSGEVTAYNQIQEDETWWCASFLQLSELFSRYIFFSMSHREDRFDT